MGLITKEEFNKIDIDNQKKTKIVNIISVLFLVAVIILLSFITYFITKSVMIVTILIGTIFIGYFIYFVININKYNKLINEELKKENFNEVIRLADKLQNKFSLLKYSCIAIKIICYFELNDESYYEKNINKLSPSIAIKFLGFKSVLYNLKHHNFYEAIKVYNQFLKIANNELNKIFCDSLLELFNFALTGVKSEKLINYDEVFESKYFTSVIDSLSNMDEKELEIFKNLWSKKDQLVESNNSNQSNQYKHYASKYRRENLKWILLNILVPFLCLLLMILYATVLILIGHDGGSFAGWFMPIFTIIIPILTLQCASNRIKEDKNAPVKLLSSIAWFNILIIIALIIISFLGCYSIV